MAEMITKQLDAIPASLKPGYFLAQEASSVSKDAIFRRESPYMRDFVDMGRVEHYFEQIAGKVDGLDYVNYWYSQRDAEEAYRIAELARQYGIDMWAGIRWQKQFRDIPVLPAEYAAWTMTDSGKIVPAMFEERNHVLDYLNPEAVDWMLSVLEERYWKHMKGVVNGWLFPESRVPISELRRSRVSIKPHKLYAYSPYVLREWKTYCEQNEICYQGRLVDRFPVASQSFADAEPAKCLYIPDNRPAAVPSGTRMRSIPVGTPVWIAFEEFLCEKFHQNYVHKIAEWMNRFHSGMPNWKGVCYFNNDSTMLDYRNFQTEGARTGPIVGDWPQGRRMGVDLHRLMQDPNITCFITETVQHCADYAKYEENYISNGLQIAESHHRRNDYGIMLHYIHSWGGLGEANIGQFLMDDLEEEERWNLIYQYKPAILSFYSVPQVLVDTAPNYNADSAKQFWEHLKTWKEMFV